MFLVTSFVVFFDAVLFFLNRNMFGSIRFDSNLTWKSHINELCLKLSKTVGILIVKSETFCQQTYSCHALLLSCLCFPLLWHPRLGLTFPSFLIQLFIIKKSNRNNIFL